MVSLVPVIARGGRAGVDEAETLSLTLQEPQEQPVPAQELEQQLVQELGRGNQG